MWSINFCAMHEETRRDQGELFCVRSAWRPTAAAEAIPPKAAQLNHCQESQFFFKGLLEMQFLKSIMADPHVKPDRIQNVHPTLQLCN